MKIIKKLIIYIIKCIIQMLENIEYRNKSLDENDISKKILNSLDTTNIKVLTDTGYESVSNIHITQPYTHYHIRTNSFYLKCADNHIVFDKNHHQILIKDLKINDYIQTKNGLEQVISINKSNFKSSMFDLTVNHINHRFYTNGILSHNTICSAINILHYLLFNNTKNVLMSANKVDTVIEVLDKIKEIYSQLPFFLQQGVKVWNQRSISLENKSKIKTTATTKTASIGFTIDYLYCDEFAYIPDNIAEKFYKSVYPTISSLSNSKITITSTPNGFNLFHKLLTDAERPEGDELKNNYHAMRVYWYNIPNRFASYIRLNKPFLEENNIDKNNIVKHLQESYPLNKISLDWNETLRKDEIKILHSPKSDVNDLKEEEVYDVSYGDFKLFQLGDITTWKRETVKDIGGIENFSQEYELKFINSAKSLLDEKMMNDLTNSKQEYKWFEIEELNKRLKWSYDQLKWTSDENAYIPILRKNYKIILTVDISEGLGQDFSVINIFKIRPKDLEYVKMWNKSFDSIKDFFTLEQIGMFRSRDVNIPQLAEILYTLAFEYFDPENVKIAMEYNTYGGELLARLPHVFNDNNEYGSYVFLTYKHSINATEERVGIKVTGGENGKNLLVKNFQDSMKIGNIIINNDINIHEISTFVKFKTSAGNLVYKAESGNDDVVMTSIHACTVIEKPFYVELCYEMLDNIAHTEWGIYVKESLKVIDYIQEKADYSSIININRNRRYINSLKNNK